MKSVNLVVVKMVVFFVLFGGMLSGGITRANASPAGCPERGHLTCSSYSTVQPCVSGIINGHQCSAKLTLLGEHPWNGCLQCYPFVWCHHASGTWEDEVCVLTCTDPPHLFSTQTESDYEWSKWDSFDNAPCP